MPRVTVLSLSGGLDSTTVLARLLNEGHAVHGLWFDYGSKHNAYEEPAVDAIARHYEIAFTRIPLAPAFGLIRSDLLRNGGEIPEGHYTDASMSRTVVPGRNTIFLAFAAGIAESIGAQAIAVGIHQGDHAIYPDCRREYYKAMDAALYLASDRKVEILAPFLDTDKTGIVTWGLAHGVPYELTRTCYKAQSVPCGKCGACVERAEAFRLNGVTDPAL